MRRYIESASGERSMLSLQQRTSNVLRSGYARSFMPDFGTCISMHACVFGDLRLIRLTLTVTVNTTTWRVVNDVGKLSTHTDRERAHWSEPKALFCIGGQWEQVHPRIDLQRANAKRQHRACIYLGIVERRLLNMSWMTKTPKKLITCCGNTRYIIREIFTYICKFHIRESWLTCRVVYHRIDNICPKYQELRTSCRRNVQNMWNRCK